MRRPCARNRNAWWRGVVPFLLLATQAAAARPDEASGVGWELLERPGHPRLEGRLASDLADGLRFIPRADPARPVRLEPGAVVLFPGRKLPAASIPPLFEASVGETARISGMLRLLDEKGLTLSVPWQAGGITIARPGVQAVFQRAGEAGVFTEDFEKLDSTRWKIQGQVDLAPAGAEPGARRSVRLAARGASLTHRLAEPLGSGRLELAFRDDGRVAAGRRWTVALSFGGAGGPATLRVLLGWAEESLAVESPDGPSLAVQRLARVPGWHRLTVRFGPEQTEIAVDGKELAHGRGPAGPLLSVGLAAASTQAAGALTPELAGQVGEVQLVRFAEPPGSLEVDTSQDEARLVVGDQLFGRIRQADPERVLIDVAGHPTPLSWGDVAGLRFRGEPAPSRPIAGPWVRAEWRASPGDGPRDVNFAEGAVAALSSSLLTLETPYCGTLQLPASRLSRLRILEPGWRQILDPSPHHLGDEVKTRPAALDPPLPEGGVLERPFSLERIDPEPLWLSLDVRDVVGATGSAFSPLVQKGEILTHVALNGARIDTLNRHIASANETTERIWIRLPAERLRLGENRIRLEQTGTASDPTFFDDLEVRQIAIQRLAAGTTPVGGGAEAVSTP